MFTAQDLLRQKGRTGYLAVSADDTVLEALRVMAEARIGAVLVREGDRIVGIYTERDYLLKGELQGRVASQTPVREVMTTQMITVTPNASVEECLRLMNEYGVRHLPVVDQGRVVGILSIRDVLFAALAARESEIRGLENFILGSSFQT
ncbi:CBS domain-containing protein [Thermoflexus sp.]|uniref:CBS domain-containing protein n=1 Tax=Thermoflexus sp. TaxID=1969742 RepID=UPI0025FCB38A|nr:CBS domain-containing protein [Thermoflexus sp.]MDW8181232.1 CBS domain-containing protein [Anaerolineae bacterium]MCS6962609.1 CBS domain-containing protein [Thermoflexus sp.]MCS7351773.1 CBS domain-containing protein [Thermoflexus sp.]MCX7690558.1 CBS domain-containing protein [Thermoflexus sp.]MDW8184830.1 CBS domain-containing protein [Anaerolineae bacterium]